MRNEAARMYEIFIMKVGVIPQQGKYDQYNTEADTDFTF